MPTKTPANTYHFHSRKNCTPACTLPSHRTILSSQSLGASTTQKIRDTIWGNPGRSAKQSVSLQELHLRWVPRILAPGSIRTTTRRNRSVGGRRWRRPAVPEVACSARLLWRRDTRGHPCSPEEGFSHLQADLLDAGVKIRCEGVKFNMTPNGKQNNMVQSLPGVASTF